MFFSLYKITFKLSQPPGHECDIGYFCTLGSEVMTPCTPGQYCNSPGLDLPVADCDSGYYCPLGSSSPQEVDCPRGYYCPVGSDVPTDCRNGTYSDDLRLQSESECTDCDAGTYCNGTALTAPSGLCQQGNLKIVDVRKLPAACG